MLKNLLGDFMSNFRSERLDGEYIEDGYLTEEYEAMEEFPEEEVVEQKPRFLQRNVRETRAVDPNSVRMQIFKPTHYEDAFEIIHLLRGRESVVMNLEYITKEDGRRIIDTVYGGIKALDGQLVKVTNTIFIAAPKNYVIEGELEKRRKASFDFR